MNSDTNLLREAYQLILESTFDNAYTHWKAETNTDTIEQYIDTFKILKQRNFLKRSEADISPWIKRPFSEFKVFVDAKSKQHEQKSAIKRTEGDIERVFENEFCTIVCPNTFEASKKYGAGTKWCISGNVIQHWKSHTEKGIKFYFILPKHNTHKLAVAVYPNNTSKEIYDELDKVISVQKFTALLKQYAIPKTVLFTNEMDWDKWLLQHKHTINPDGSVDIDGDMNLSEMKLKKLPFKFGKVTGNFYCYNNQLTSLQGAPSKIRGDFCCHYNQLTSLQGVPSKVRGDFYCSYNQLTSLQGAPSKVRGDFYCYCNQLTSLQGAPSKVRGDFYCHYNQLTSLQGAPSKVGGNFYCDYNQLTSLQGAPSSVGGDFYCSYNQLTSLQGAPSSVGGDFICDYNQLTSLQGAPSSVGGDFYCENNQLTSLQGAPSSVGGDFICSSNPKLKQFEIDKLKIFYKQQKMKEKNITEVFDYNNYQNSNTNLLREAYQLILETQDAKRNWFLTKAYGPKTDSIIVVTSPSNSGTYTVTYLNGAITSIKTNNHCKLDVPEINRMFNDGHKLGDAISAGVYFDTGPEENMNAIRNSVSLAPGEGNINSAPSDGAVQ